MINLLGGKLTLILAIALTISAGGHALAYNKIEKQITEIAILEASVISQQGVINELRSSFELAQESLQEQSQALRELQLKYNDRISELESFKKRQSVALRKPKLVEKLANKATAKVFQDLSTATGGK